MAFIKQVLPRFVTVRATDRLLLLVMVVELVAVVVVKVMVDKTQSYTKQQQYDQGTFFFSSLQHKQIIADDDAAAEPITLHRSCQFRLVSDILLGKNLEVGLIHRWNVPSGDWVGRKPPNTARRSSVPRPFLIGWVSCVVSDFGGPCAIHTGVWNQTFMSENLGKFASVDKSPKHRLTHHRRTAIGRTAIDVHH
jgi:hypothetical protein